MDRAIIVAAGMGRRLSPYTDDRPKCLVPINGRPILAYQLDAYRAAGVREFTIVRGYLAQRLTDALDAEAPGIRFVDNHDYQRNNILLSLLCAADAMDGGFLFSYADIVFRPEVVAQVAAAPGPLALVVDPFWARAYEGRSEHPVSEAELAAVSDGRVTAVGKRVVPAAEARGEFIGLMRVDAEGADLLRATFRRRRDELGLDGPYGRAPRLQVAYVTDLLNDLIAQGVPIHSVEIQTPDAWREIDTVQDLERAHTVVRW